MYEITCPHNTKINIVFDKFGYLNYSNGMFKLKCCNIDLINLYYGYREYLLSNKQFVFGIYVNNTSLTLSKNFVTLNRGKIVTKIPHNIEFDSYQESFDYLVKLTNNLEFL